MATERKKLKYLVESLDQEPAGTLVELAVHVRVLTTTRLVLVLPFITARYFTLN